MVPSWTMPHLSKQGEKNPLDKENPEVFFFVFLDLDSSCSIRKYLPRVSA